METHTDSSDWQLLREYVERSSEAAFALLVRRYVNLVYSASLRQLPNTSLAEDVVQQVFILLARKAHRLGPGTILAGWLFQTTRHVAHTLKRSEVRRFHRESEAVSMMDLEPEDTPWEQLAPLLDDALGQLRDSDRAAVLLRFFQQLPWDQVGAALGLTPDAAKKRVGRALERLRSFFAQQGVVLPAAVLSGVLLARGVQAAPVGLAERASAGALANRGTPAGASGLVLAQWLRRLGGPKARFAAGLLGALAGVILVAVSIQPARPPAKPSRETNPAISQDLPKARLATAKALVAPSAAWSLPLRVLGSIDDSGLPRVSVQAVFMGTNSEKIELATDRNGLCRIPLAGRAFHKISARINADGYVPKIVEWFQYELGSEIEEYTVRLDRGLVFTGLVSDQHTGLPVAGAELTIIGSSLNLAERENVGTSSVRSTSQGEWFCNQLPSHTHSVLVRVEHRDYAFLSTNLPLDRAETATPVLVLNSGVSLVGLVVDRAGLPVPGAVVTDDDSVSENRHLLTNTDDNGEFFFPHVKPGTVRLRAWRDGQEGSYQLDASGNVEGVRLALLERAKANVPGSPGGIEPALHLVGQVTDIDTGEPVKRFRVLLAERVVGGESWGSSQTFTEPALFLGEGKAGQFDWNCPPPPPGGLLTFTLEVRADGYIPERSPPTTVRAELAPFQFRLKKDQLVSGRILTPEGQPAAQAMVLLTGRNSAPTIQASSTQPLGLRIYSKPDNQATSDDQGRFVLRTSAATDHAILLHESGCRIVTFEACRAEDIRLQAWGHIAGDLRIGDNPGAHQPVGVRPAPLERQDLRIPFSCLSLRTDAQGHFILPRVPPGSYSVFRIISPAGAGPKPFGTSHHVTVQVQPGETCPVLLGGQGRRVIGSIRTVPDDVILDWNSDLQRLTAHSSDAVLPQLEDFPDSAAFAQAMAVAQPSCYLTINPDGTFIVDDVPPGSYQLRISLSRAAETPGAPPGVRLPIGSLIKEVTIPEAIPGKDESVDLGSITVEIQAP